MSRVIDDLLDLTRIEAEEAPPREPVLVSLVMAEAFERVRAAAEHRGVQIEVDEPSDPGRGARRPPPARLGDVQPARERSEVLLRRGHRRVRRAGRRVTRWRSPSSTTESGSRPATSTAIFERFYRVDQGRSRQTGGTGLGLSIVRHVAANHQGRVEVESREGEGSTFRLTLPAQSEL